MNKKNPNIKKLWKLDEELESKGLSADTIGGTNYKKLFIVEAEKLGILKKDIEEFINNPEIMDMLFKDY